MGIFLYHFVEHRPQDLFGVERDYLYYEFIMIEIIQLLKDTKLEACIDNRSPFSFTRTGARESFQLQETRHIRGKVVIDFKR